MLHSILERYASDGQPSWQDSVRHRMNLQRETKSAEDCPLVVDSSGVLWCWWACLSIILYLRRGLNGTLNTVRREQVCTI